MSGFLRRLLRLPPLKEYTFRHRGEGAEVTFKAKDESRARRYLRAFIQEKMFGSWAMFYNPAAVERELKEIDLVEVKELEGRDG